MPRAVVTTRTGSVERIAGLPGHAVSDLQEHRARLEAAGRTPDQLANRVFDPAMNEPRRRS